MWRRSLAISMSRLKLPSAARSEEASASQMLQRAVQEGGRRPRSSSFSSVVDAELYKEDILSRTRVVTSVAESSDITARISSEQRPIAVDMEGVQVREDKNAFFSSPLYHGTHKHIIEPKERSTAEPMLENTSPVTISF